MQMCSCDACQNAFPAKCALPRPFLGALPKPGQSPPMLDHMANTPLNPKVMTATPQHTPYFSSAPCLGVHHIQIHDAHRVRLEISRRQKLHGDFMLFNHQVPPWQDGKMCTTKSSHNDIPYARVTNLDTLSTRVVLLRQQLLRSARLAFDRGPE